jgi:hypothetical protein
VKTLYGASRWLEENHDADQFLLWVEAFDPHEPYDAPKYYLDLYEKEGQYEGYDFTHPSYAYNEFDKKETQHLRNRCKALMTMTDRHIGEILDVMDQYDMWKDTMLIFTTDHGFHLGEHGYMGKNYMPDFNEVFHIPLIICGPEIKPGRCSALTQNVDVFPTILEHFEIDEKVVPYSLHGKSMLPLLKRKKRQIHSDIIYGYFGHEVTYNDGKYTYIRAAKDITNRPLNMYCSVPTLLRQYLGADDGCKVENYHEIKMGRFLKWTNYPVYCFPADIIDFSNWSQSFENRKAFNSKNMIFNIHKDYAQDHPIHDDILEGKLIEKLKKAMIRCDTPLEQLERLGI